MTVFDMEGNCYSCVFVFVGRSREEEACFALCDSGVQLIECARNEHNGVWIELDILGNLPYFGDVESGGVLDYYREISIVGELLLGLRGCWMC